MRAEELKRVRDIAALPVESAKKMARTQSEPHWQVEALMYRELFNRQDGAR